jgi:diguanylate cyclase (GGDEF)-like protein
MEPPEVLAEAIIEILKQFSERKRPINSASLREAFSTRQDISDLLYVARDVPVDPDGQGLSSRRKLSGVSPVTSETPKESDNETVSQLRNVFLKILDGLGPMIKGGYESRFSELQNKISECESLLPLGQIGERIGQMASELINDAIERTEFWNDFLVELYKDLYKMEEDMASYQTYNRETHEANSEFYDDVLSNTDEIHRIFDVDQGRQDIRSLITYKLNTISKTIETKRESDEVRLREADASITELQDNLRISKQEILQVKERSESLEKEVLLDALTQINNRRAYDLQIRENLRGFHRNGELFSLILIDIDHFKRVNDHYGHKAGDKCLKEIAKLIKSCLRQSDFLARFGGEELIVILKGSGAGDARNVAEKIRGFIERTRFSYKDEIIPITISLGVTEVMASDTDPETPFIRVDEAMYRAKNDGRNRVCAITDLSFRKIPQSSFPDGRVADTAN